MMVHLCVSGSTSSSKTLPLCVVDPVGSCCSTILLLLVVLYDGHSGERGSLKVLGFPTRTKDSQYAINSDANEVSTGFMGVNVTEPLGLFSTDDQH